MDFDRTRRGNVLHAIYKEFRVSAHNPHVVRIRELFNQVWDSVQAVVLSHARHTTKHQMKGVTWRVVLLMAQYREFRMNRKPAEDISLVDLFVDIAVAK